MGSGIYSARIPDGSRCRFLLLWSRTAQVGFVADMAVHDGHSCCQFPGKHTSTSSQLTEIKNHNLGVVVPLGILSHLFTLRGEIYRKLQ